MTSPGTPDWAGLGVPRQDTEPVDADVEHLAGPDEVDALEDGGDHGDDGDDGGSP